MDLSAGSSARARSRRRPSSRRRAHALGGRRTRRVGAHRGPRARGHRRVRARRHDGHGRRGHVVRRRSTRRSPSTARSARSIPAITRRRSAASSRAACRASAGCGTARCATTCSRCASSTGDGRLVKGGGPTVKNVTGYDLPRLFVGSLGTLGVLVQVTLRCRPRPRRAAGSRRRTAGRRATAPSARLWDGDRECVLLEGAAADVDAQAGELGAAPTRRRCPTGAHRGRISVAPGACRAVGHALERIDGVRWCAELGVGTVHVAADDAAALDGARARSRTRTADGCCARPGGDRRRRVRPRRCRTSTSCAASRTRSIPTGKLHTRDGCPL